MNWTYLPLLFDLRLRKSPPLIIRVAGLLRSPVPFENTNDALQGIALSRFFPFAIMITSLNLKMGKIKESTFSDSSTDFILPPVSWGHCFYPSAHQEHMLMLQLQHSYHQDSSAE